MVLDVLPWSFAVSARLARVAPKDLDDELRLVEAAHAGDRRALGELCQRYGPTLYRSVLLPRLGSEAAAKDALSETYVRVVAKIQLFHWQGVGFYPWLRTVALRVALDALRARKHLLLWSADDVARELDRASTETPLDVRLSEARDRAKARQRVEEALATLHPRYARVIRLRVLEDRPRDEVAAMLEVSTSTFDVLLHRSLAALRKSLEARGKS